MVVADNDFIIMVGKNIRAYRRMLGISQYTLAKITGINWAEVSKMELGKRNITLHTLSALAKGLQISPEKLVMKCT